MTNEIFEAVKQESANQEVSFIPSSSYFLASSPRAILSVTVDGSIYAIDVVPLR